MAGVDSNGNGTDCGNSFLQLGLVTTWDVNVAGVSSACCTWLVLTFLILSQTTGVLKCVVNECDSIETWLAVACDLEK